MDSATVTLRLLVIDKRCFAFYWTSPAVDVDLWLY